MRKGGFIWRQLNSWWLILSLFGGLFSWVAFYYVGWRTGRKNWIRWGIFYTLPFLYIVIHTVWQLSETIGNQVLNISCIILVFSIVHSLLIQDRYLRLLTYPQGGGFEEVHTREVGFDFETHHEHSLIWRGLQRVFKKKLPKINGYYWVVTKDDLQKSLSAFLRPNVLMRFLEIFLPQMRICTDKYYIQSRIISDDEDLAIIRTRIIAAAEIEDIAKILADQYATEIANSIVHNIFASYHNEISPPGEAIKTFAIRGALRMIFGLLIMLAIFVLLYFLVEWGSNPIFKWFIVPMILLILVGLGKGLFSFLKAIFSAAWPIICPGCKVEYLIFQNMAKLFCPCCATILVLNKRKPVNELSLYLCPDCRLYFGLNEKLHQPYCPICGKELAETDQIHPEDKDETETEFEREID